MHAIDYNAAIQFERGTCPACKGTGKAVIVGRQESLRTGKPDVLELPCPACAGRRVAGLRTKG